MADTSHHHSNQTFSDVTLLVTHFNRSASLERLLKTFNDLSFLFGEVIVSDDASNAFHSEKLRQLKDEYGFTLITSAVNGGLGNNLNKGSKAVKTPLTLYVQEDFIPTEVFLKPFISAVDFMNADNQLDLVRFYAYHSYPYLKPFKDGFSEMLYKPYYTDKNKIYQYSDHPHLRRRNFLERFGVYTEGIKSDKTEYEMSISFIRKGGKGLFYNQYKSLFIQENSAEEPSTVDRRSWTKSDNVAVSMIRWVYRQVKFNYDIHFNPKFK